MLTAIALGVVALVLSGGFVHDLYRQLGESTIQSQAGHLQIAHPALFAEGSRSPERYRITGVEKIRSELMGTPSVQAVTARLTFSGLLSNGRVDFPILGEGIEVIAAEGVPSTMKILAGRALADRDSNGVLVGEGLARTLGLEPGDKVTLLASTLDGAMNTADLEIVGVSRSLSKDYDARAVKVLLSTAQELLATQDVNLVAVQLSDTAATRPALVRVAARLQPRGLVVKTWDELDDFYANTVQLYDRQFGVLRLIVLVLVTLGVANTVNIGVFERLAEFGTMRAVGTTGGSVTRLILLECLILGCMGALVGALGGLALSNVISSFGLAMPPLPNSNAGYTARIMLSLDSVVQAATVGVAATVASGVLPAWRAARIPIVDSLRSAL